MNVLFVCIFALSSAALLLSDPSAFLPALLSGAEDALRLGATLAAVYTVWLGFLKIAEDARLTRGLAKGLRPVTSRLFRTQNPAALGQIAVNLSANLLGMGGAATPAGVSAMGLLEGTANRKFSQAMLFVVNCVGLQFLPVTAIALRERYGSASSYDIILPVFLASAAALVAGAALVFRVCGRKARKKETR